MKILVKGKYFNARPAREADIPVIAGKLRENDRLELERMYTETPLEVMKRSFADSRDRVWTAVAPDGEPVAMWGVSPLNASSSFGVVWLLGTERIDECRRDFLEFSRFYERIMQEGFSATGNAVDVTYTGAIQWLKWLGYTTMNTIRSPLGFDFVFMVKDVSHVR